MLVMLRMNEEFMRHMRSHDLPYIKKMQPFGCTVVQDKEDPKEEEWQY